MAKLTKAQLKFYDEWVENNKKNNTEETINISWVNEETGIFYICQCNETFCKAFSTLQNIQGERQTIQVAPCKLYRSMKFSKKQMRLLQKLDTKTWQN